MFLDDELNQIFEENGFNPDTSVKLIQACINHMPSQEETKTMSVPEFLTRLKQIDNAWKLFVKKHPGYYKEDAWRIWVLKSDTNGKFKKALNW